MYIYKSLDYFYFTSSNHQMMTTSPCPHWYFTCANGECIDKDLVCDGLVACSDWSDESFTYASCIGKYSKFLFVTNSIFNIEIIIDFITTSANFIFTILKEDLSNFKQIN